MPRPVPVPLSAEAEARRAQEAEQDTMPILSSDVPVLDVPVALPGIGLSYYPHPLWFEWLAEAVEDPAFQLLQARLKKEDRDPAIRVFPPARERYAALRLSPLDVKVVVLGQDPYHGAGQAHGLAFSVRPDVRIPPSLMNIYKEVEAEGLGPAAGRNGCLQAWADQGVLLLNNVLTVREGQAGSHRGLGWEGFTDTVVRRLNERREGLVFLLWGKDAATKAHAVDKQRHLVLTSPHPSPFSAHSGFLGNGHFKQANQWLELHDQAPIVW